MRGKKLQVVFRQNFYEISQKCDIENWKKVEQIHQFVRKKFLIQQKSKNFELLSLRMTLHQQTKRHKLCTSEHFLTTYSSLLEMFRQQQNFLAARQNYPNYWAKLEYLQSIHKILLIICNTVKKRKYSPTSLSNILEVLLWHPIKPCEKNVWNLIRSL